MTQTPAQRLTELNAYELEWGGQMTPVRCKLRDALDVANELAAENERLREAVSHTDGCFEAALAEGWIDAVANGDIERIQDIWGRRLSCARDNFPATLAATATDKAGEGVV